MIISRAPDPDLAGEAAGGSGASGTARNKALLLDRDGLVNIDRNYVHDRGEFEFVPGIFDLCRTASEQGYRIVVVTNQAGIARGFYTEQDFVNLTLWMEARFAEQHVSIDGVYYCPYHPEHGLGEYRRRSNWRKPEPGMIVQAALDFNLDLPSCILVGDQETDVMAGVNAGVGCNVLVCADRGRATRADCCLGSTAAVAEWLTERRPAPGTPR